MTARSTDSGNDRTTQPDFDSVTDLRLKLVENGYEVIPNLDKRTFMKDWPKLPQDEATIRRWERRYSRYATTGLRLANELAVIDIDVLDPDLVDTIAAVFEDMLDDWGIDVNAVMIRGTTATAKEAWFVRTEERFGRIHTHRWRAPGASVDDPTSHVEIFGGASARQFGAFGAHSHDERDQVCSWYDWGEGPTPLDTPISEVPALDKQQFSALAAEADRLIQGAGYEQVLLSKAGEDRAERIYDLDEGMHFDCDDGVTRTLSELRDAAGGGDLRCSASWLEGAEARRRDRCIVWLERSGGVAVWETSSGVTHCEVSKQPVTDWAQKLDLEEVRTKLKTLSKMARQRITTEDEFDTVATKLLETYAFCDAQMKNVLPINARELTDGMTLGNFRTKFLPWHKIEIGPRGGETKVNPADVWINRRDRVDVAGIRCEPGADFPMFEEDGQKWINTFRPPLWTGEGGEIEPWIDYLEHLIPNADERRWFSQWLAYKARHPGIPGPAVLMVAPRTQGTGRGSLFDVMESYWGARFVRTVKFSTFTGKTHQAQYNEWQVGSVMAFINESSEATDGSAYQTKHNTYEHLKEVLDPRPRRIEVLVKGRDNYVAQTHTSILIASNHVNALPVDESDRRVCVITNGEKMSADMADALHRWRASPANLAALQQWLWDVDLTSYNPFSDPPVFTGKTRMAAANKTVLDEAVDDALDELKSRLFTIPHVQEVINRHFGHGELPNNWKVALQRLIPERYARVGDRGEGNWRIKIGGRKYVVYATSPQEAARWSDLDGVRREVLKNGDPSSPSDIGQKLQERLAVVAGGKQ